MSSIYVVNFLKDLLDDEEEKKILELLEQGYSTDEIIKQLMDSKNDGGKM